MKYEPRAVSSYDKLPGIKLSNKTAYITLAVINKNSSAVSKMDKFTKGTLHWDIDDIIRDKRRVSLEEVGKLEDGTSATRILVQGAPGVGKTTMASEMCRRWKDGKLLTEYSLVVMLRMRDTRLHKAKTISDLFIHDDPEIHAAIVKKMTATKGRGVFLIIEGFDELSDELQKDSIFADVIHRDSLQEATVMVTSRPSASDVAHAIMPAVKIQHVEVIGFNREQIDEFVEEIIVNESVVRSFRQCLDRFPYIRGIMYVPLNCAIVVMVYQYNQETGFFPRTQTELYTEVTRILLVTYLSAKPGLYPTLECLPSEIRAQFAQLCEMAYEGILGNKLIFECLPPGTRTLGLFEAVPDMHNPDAKSYNFLHLSVQEYLAARHVAALSVSEQTQCFDSLASNRRMTVVLRFLAGLTKFHYKLFSKVGFWGKLTKSRNPTDSLRECIHDSETFTDTIHWLYEAQEEMLARRALGSNVQSLDRTDAVLSPFDCYALGYSMLHSECVWELRLPNCNIDSEGMNNLVASGDSFSRVKVIDLSRNDIGETGGKLGE